MSKLDQNDPANNQRKGDPTPHLAEAHELSERVLDALDRAIPSVPEYSVEAVKFLRAEVAVARRRILNVYRVLHSGNRAG